MSALPLDDEVLSINAWVDPVVEAFGFAPEHPYLERCWTPILGPTSVALWRRLALAALENPAGTRVHTDQLARELGVSTGALARSLRRLVDFEMARGRGVDLSVRVAVPPLPERRLRRLPATVRVAHEHLSAGFVLPSRNPLAEAALAYASRGWPVFPLRARAKVPDGRLAPHGLHDATTEPAQITAWWRASPLANVGVATGRTIDVVDIDGPSAGSEDGSRVLDQVRSGLVSPGAIVSTGRGWHLYFGPSGLPTRAGVLPGIDVRGAGGYVVAPPSVHPSGAQYRFVNAEGIVLDDQPGEDPLPPAPDWIIELCQPTPSPRPAVERGWEPRRLDLPAYARAALADECAQMASTPEGSRNDRLNRAAFAMGTLVGSGVLDESVAAEGLLAAAGHAGLSEAEATRTIASGLDAGRARPRGRSSEDSVGLVESRVRASTAQDRVRKLGSEPCAPPRGRRR